MISGFFGVDKAQQFHLFSLSFERVGKVAHSFPIILVRGVEQETYTLGLVEVNRMSFHGNAPPPKLTLVQPFSKSSD